LAPHRPFDIIGAARSLRIAAAMACALLSASGAWAAGIESCEKIKDADAYNACLASYGPAVGEHRFTRAPAPESEVEPPRTGQRRGQGKAAARKTPGAKAVQETAHTLKRQANGRVRIEIYPGR
jgi:TRAP-type C4-dicarboxylate transport system substrate-binding protein